ncbi:MAG: F0F1 ATP synthase subunit B [Arenicellales bacterium]|jgi:F-type H+-transporting ATPase subunit b|nr:F0F1 ATP synthase subunit B [Arenicellales bacterium]HCV21026.1 F0F1 ATP synthase subunit B [Gammaproteobacteria bacterium]MDP6313559.1 F0F1 ATP synthase subunit B [Arenicellales bacterium]MDP7118908.1 F0F1 ATP synthase subunit B [Arenicellales bacterium]MDP7193195.1 F0F1 ATP synthase subunit B [Arenicellales bacterium]|tara:strand:+ start:1068 stop:1538 length:471 start_codon:yes stop_codon:yes gene_type:complete
MNINLTLIGQSIAFIIFVWFCMKFIWPLIISALDERKTRIADGLAAAEEGQKEKARAQEHVAQAMSEAKEQAQEIIRRAERREVEMVEEAKNSARVEGERILVAAKSEIEKEANIAREALRGQVAALAVAGAAKILSREVDESAHARMLDDLTAEL